MENLSVYYWVLKRDLKVLSESLKDNLINCFFITGTLCFVFGYLMPIFGINQELIAPLFLGSLVFLNINITDIQSIQISHDLFTNKFTYYLLTLPASKKWVLGAKTTSLVIEMLLINIPVVIFAKILLGQHLAINFNHLPSIIILYLLGIIYIATLCIAIVLGSSFTWLTKNVFARIYLPLIFLGCLDTPLTKVQEYFPKLKFLFYISPITYLLEGWRGILLGNPSIPLYVCTLVLLAWIIVNIGIARIMLKKKHDLI